jgi:hypothetical protein
VIQITEDATRLGLSSIGKERLRLEEANKQLGVVARFRRRVHTRRRNGKQSIDDCLDDGSGYVRLLIRQSAPASQQLLLADLECMLMHSRDHLVSQQASAAICIDMSRMVTPMFRA